MAHLDKMAWGGIVSECVYVNIFLPIGGLNKMLLAGWVVGYSSLVQYLPGVFRALGSVSRTWVSRRRERKMHNLIGINSRSQ